MFRRIQNIRHLNNSIKFGFFKPPDFDISKDYYKALNVKPSDSQETIKQAYYALAKKHHPDLNKGNEEQFKIIKEAYEVLSDSDKKQQYDLSRSYGGGQGQSDAQGSDGFNQGRGPFAGFNQQFHQQRKGTGNQGYSESYTYTYTYNSNNKQRGANQYSQQEQQEAQRMAEEVMKQFLNNMGNFASRANKQGNQRMDPSFNKFEQFVNMADMAARIYQQRQRQQQEDEIKKEQNIHKFEAKQQNLEGSASKIVNGVKHLWNSWKNKK